MGVGGWVFRSVVGIECLGIKTERGGGGKKVKGDFPSGDFVFCIV